MSELVTGDAVVLGLRPARLPSRALAIFVDLLVLWTAYLLLSLVLTTMVLDLDGAAVAAVRVGLLVLVLMGVPVAVETLTHGRSLGKLACGLRVVRVDGGPIRFRHAFVRGLVGFLEIQLTLGTVACTASLVSAQGRRLGDVFAGALVVSERLPVPRAGAVPPPPPALAGHFAALDLSQVPDGLWLAVRQYLTRVGQLDPQAGLSLGGRLADDVVAATGTPPPAGVPAAVYLSGVLAERRRREAGRSGSPGHEHGRPDPAPVPSGALGDPGAWPGPAHGGSVHGESAHVAPSHAASGDERRSAVEERDRTPGGGFVPPA